MRSSPPPKKKRDEALTPKIQGAWDESFGGAYGARKVWRQLRVEGVEVARFKVGRLMGDMREMGLRGVVRGARSK